MFFAPTSQFKLANNDSQTLGKIFANAVSVVLTTGLLVYIILFGFIYLSIGAIWIAILQSDVGDSIRNIQTSRALDTIGSIFIFIYLYIWLAEAISGYADGPTKLRQLLYDIGYLTNHITTSIKKEKITTQDLNHLNDFVCSLIVSIFRLFLGVDDIHYNLKNRDRIDIILNAQTKMFGADNLTISTNIALQIQEWIHTLEKLQVIENTQMHYFNSNFDLIMKALRDIDSATRVNKPYIFRGHLIFSLYLYFILWLPLLLDGIFGDVGMLIIYPFLMLVLTGPIIYRYWLKDPFDSNGPLRYNNYYAWFVEYIEKIAIFTRTHSI